MAKITKDDHKRMSMEHVLFAKQELERRKKAPVHVKSEEIWVEGREPYRTTFIVDPRIGWNNHAIRFWIRSLPRKLYKLWDEAKRLSLLDDEDPTFSNFVWVRDLWEEERELFGGDPWRYGMTANQKVIKTLIRYGVEQGIASAKIDAEKLFLPIK